MSNGSVICWGYNGGGQLGTGDRLARSSPGDRVVGLTDTVEITTGNAHSCARRSSGTIASLATVGGAGDVHRWDFGTSRWRATGILNFTDIAVEVDGVAHMQGGDVRNLNSQRVTGGVIHFHDTTDGGGNDAAIAAGEVTFDKHTPPGTLATMGVGL